MTDPEAAWGDLGRLATIQVRVLMYQAGIVIEVWDRDPGTPAGHDAASDEESGRGLMIVTALCKEWDYFCVARSGNGHWFVPVPGCCAASVVICCGQLPR